MSAAQKESARHHAFHYRRDNGDALLRHVTDCLLQVAWLQTHASKYAAGRLVDEIVELENARTEPATTDDLVDACLHLAAVAWFDRGDNVIPTSYSTMENRFLTAAERCFWDVAIEPEPESIRTLVRGGDPEESPFVLYRHWGENQTLLYVGQTSRFWSRQTAHKSAAAWWTDVVAITWEPFETREAVLLAESAAIEAECPVANRQRGRA